ncbi:hypothetical protein H8E88_27415 [candidate division KSB1 bacterium]|nr:hypothetical protein [candidate division KSB1 bacterium]MBL7094754.1 hypothetical protein [candidate division KSB1 bacterium]
MLTVKGVYDHGRIKMIHDVKFDKTINVLITFLEDFEIQNVIPKREKTFSFKKSKKLLKNYKGSLSQAVLDERRSQL